MASVPVAQLTDHYQGSHANQIGATSHGEDNTFDYVIVGGGTAGLTIAARLIQGSSSTVAVIEAGGSYEKDNGIFSTTPGYCVVGAGTDTSTYNPLVDWGYATVPQKAADGRQIGYPRGKTLGGCSARNFMYYHRPTAGALGKWAHEVGDEGYEFQNFLPYYQRSVQYTPPTVPFTNSTNTQDPKAWSSTGGPLQLSHGAYVDPLATWIQPAVRKLGFEDIAGFSSGKLIGSGYLPYSVNPETQQRSSSEASFLQSVRGSPSLQVYPNTLAEKILLDKDKKATGVCISSNGTKTNLHAKKEVILSAGVFNSPQLLMLSGIGPRSKLESFNIPVHVDLPGVGESLEDHPLFGSVYRVNLPTASGLLNNPDIATAIQKAYDEQKAGPLTIPASGFIAWEKLPSPYRQKLTPSSRSELDELPSDWPELEHVSMSASTGYQRNYVKEDPNDGFNYASILTSMVAPLSRGSVTLKSSNPADLPLVDPNFFAHPGDVTLAIASVRRQRDIWRAMDKSIVDTEYLPGANVTSDEDIFKFIKESLAPTWHAACSCKMGKRGDKMAVVDNEAKVFGTKGLRVVDASAFPFLPPGHPQATVYALAEKVVDIILKGEKTLATS